MYKNAVNTKIKENMCFSVSFDESKKYLTYRITL